MREFQMAFITSAEVKRWMQVLSVMEQERRFTIGELSEQLAISQRTLIKDIQTFKKYFGTSIELRSNYSGYHFEERNRSDYQEKKEQLLENEVLFEIVGNVFCGKDFTIADLAHQYSYAESTLRRFFLRIRPVLAEYELTLAFNPVNFLGEEVNIRKFFFDFYYSSEQTPYTIRPPESLHTLVLNELSGKLGTGITISAFYYHLYIAMVRVHQNHFVSLPEWLKASIYQEKDFQLLYSLQERIKEEYEIYLPKEEFAWIHLLIISKRTIHRVDQEQTFNQRFSHWKDLQFIVSDYLSDPFFEQWDTNTLGQFMTSFFISRLMNEAVGPVLNKELEEIHWMVKKSDKQIYEAHKQFLLKHAQVLSFSAQYFEDIVVSFTTYMNLLFHYYQPVKKVLFLLEGDYLIVQSIRMQARVLLGEYHKLLFMQLQELTPERLNDVHVDLIVTNYRPYLLDFALDTDHILMSSIPTAQDWARVKHQLNPLIDQETF
ncbi:helix-turn-helix domain-containing protein [Enterococcus mundtii]|uniref:PRD domain-containing protein n=1 Tax=Enterococcus mundtii TaxID=53346 RepID=A0A242KW17_ENTMU|nr:helix-turn-helix domain-containing protein [Enterococcus mundtii]OTP25522.1 hypothetical protein A5802_002675 [Enterococcus mundtii]